MTIKLVLVTLAVVVLAPVAVADPVSGGDRANAARTCTSLRMSMGDATFKLTYGTTADRSNAFGRCVSQHARAEHAERHAAEASCASERSDPNFAATHGGKTFDQFYGTGRMLRNAFGRCLSAKTQAARAERRQDTLNAARQCKAELKATGVTAFRAKYGTNENDRNAFGKCVSALAKSQND